MPGNSYTVIWSIRDRIKEYEVSISDFDMEFWSTTICREALELAVNRLTCDLVTEFDLITMFGIFERFSMEPFQFVWNSNRGRL